MTADVALAAAYLRGEHAAMAKVDAWILPVVRHRAWRLGDEVEDLVQEVRFKLLRLFANGAFRGDSSLKTYVQSTAKYTSLDAVRRARVRTTEDMDVEQFRSPRDEPWEELDREESLRLCVRVLSGLPDNCRHLFRLILEQGLSYEEIRDELGVAMGTVKSRLARCRDRAVLLRAAFLAERRGGRKP